MASGKLHQYLRILVKRGIVDVVYEDDADLMSTFLSRPDLQKIARQAWETQKVLVTAESGVDVHMLAKHIHWTIKNHLSEEEATRKAIEYFRIEDPSTEDAQIKIYKARASIESLRLRSPWNLERHGYSRVSDLLGISKKDLLEIDGVGEKSADAILAAMYELFTENSRAISQVKRSRE